MEDVEDSDPPQQKVNTTDEETMAKLLSSIRDGNADDWAVAVEALKEAGYLQTESETPDVGSVGRYFKERAEFTIGKEHTRLAKANREEEERIRKEQEEAAAAAAAEEES